MLKDLRHAVRVLFATKGWTAVVLVSLALGIGANTALFSAVNTLLIETVPVPDPETLIRLKWHGKNDMVRNTSDYGFSRPGSGDARVTIEQALGNFPGVFQQTARAGMAAFVASVCRNSPAPTRSTSELAT